MSFGFVYFCTLLKFLSLVNCLNDEACGELRFVAVVFRHGDRAPERPYPEDPYSDGSCWPNGWGQLTKRGKLQQYELGKWIRRRYWNYLPIAYNASDVYVQSTDVDRTLMSAYCNLAGLYECWNEEESEGLVLQPVPVHTTPVRLDATLAGRKRCPAYEELLRDSANAKEVRERNEFHRDVFRKLSCLTGLRIASVEDCVFLYGTLHIQKLSGLTLPDWADDFYPRPLQEIAEFAFGLPCRTTAMKRLKCGPLVKDILAHMQDRKDGKIPQKMWMYSGHDTTLVNLMQCLGAFDGSLPPCAATLLLELYEREGEWYVRVAYKTPDGLRFLKLPCCDGLCPFRDFKRILAPVIPADWERECTKN